MSWNEITELVNRIWIKLVLLVGFQNIYKKMWWHLLICNFNGHFQTKEVNKIGEKKIMFNISRSFQEEFETVLKNSVEFKLLFKDRLLRGTFKIKKRQNLGKVPNRGRGGHRKFKKVASFSWETFKMRGGWGWGYHIS